MQIKIIEYIDSVAPVDEVDLSSRRCGKHHVHSRTSLTSFAFHRDGNEPSHAVSDARYRYIRYSDGFEELYDLENDPTEFKNLANERDHVEIKSTLLKGVPKTAATNVGVPQDSPYHRARRAK